MDDLQEEDRKKMQLTIAKKYSEDDILQSYADKYAPKQKPMLKEARTCFG